MHQLQRTFGLKRCFSFATASLRISTANRALAQCFDVGKQVFASLLAQNFSKQHPQGPHIATQRSFFQIA
jgi:hypothetical protein